ncbi:MAG: AcvB/VirJ family lysyl-phosphatidylglycerol hydrolase [Chitinophagaceae bacterium]
MRSKSFNIIIYILLLLPFKLLAAGLPVQEWAGANDKPLVLYISGDGGLNDFSKSLCAGINGKGYNVTAINSRSYFWDKKTPGQTASDINNYITGKLKGRVSQQIILIGYSFGADVAPFVANRLDSNLSGKLKSVILLSPSGSTDFEIHWSDLLGGDRKRSSDVVAEINKMKVNRLATVFGSNETDFPVSNIKVSHYYNYRLTGGHHYAGNIEDLVRLLETNFG